MSRNYARFIPGEEVTDVAHWDFSAFGQPQRSKAQMLQDDAQRNAHEEAIRQQAFELAYAQGIEEGQAMGEARAQARFDDFWKQQGQDTAHRMASLVDALAQRLREVEQTVATSVLEMSCDIARHVVRRELALNPDSLQPVVREALDALIADARSTVVRLSAVDFDALQQALQQEFGAIGVSFVVDAAIEPGGCVVESAGALIDGTLERRWERAVARLGTQAAWQEADRSTALPSADGAAAEPPAEAAAVTAAEPVAGPAPEPDSEPDSEEVDDDLA